MDCMRPCVSSHRKAGVGKALSQCKWWWRSQCHVWTGNCDSLAQASQSCNIQSGLLHQQLLHIHDMCPILLRGLQKSLSHRLQTSMTSGMHKGK